MSESWKSFWERQTKPLHNVDDESFYQRHAAELSLLTGDPAGKRVLDLGCGDGALYRHIGFHRASRYVGVDFSESMLAGFREKEPGVELVAGSALQIPVQDAFDIVFSNGLVQYFNLREFKEHLRSVLGVLAPGGVYVCGSMPGRERFLSLVMGRAAYPAKFSLRRGLKELGAYAAGRAALGQWYSLRDVERSANAVGAGAMVFGSTYYLYRYHAVFRAADQNS